MPSCYKVQGLHIYDINDDNTDGDGRCEADHADSADPAVYSVHHGHGHPLRFLLRHQTVAGSPGPGGAGGCRFRH